MQLIDDQNRTTCKHDFVFIESQKWECYSGYQTKFTKINRYFCRHCLKHEEVKQEEYSREKPYWF